MIATPQRVKNIRIYVRNEISRLTTCSDVIGISNFATFYPI